MAVCSVLGAVSVLEVAAPREQLGGLGADRLGDGLQLLGLVVNLLLV